MHKLWMPSPLQINILLLCAGPDWEEWHFAQWDSFSPPLHLAQLAAPASIDEPAEMWNLMSQQSYPGYAVALATVIEYAVVTYGRERLPALVAGMDRYDILMLCTQEHFQQFRKCS